MEFMEIEGCPYNEEDEVLDIDLDSKYEKFDTTVGHIEDIIMSEEFQDLQNNFFDKHSHEFDDGEENKFVYTDIHKEYVDVVESHLTKKLKEMISDFSMEEFSEELSVKEMDVDNEIFEILFSFANFPIFKEMMISHKKSKETPTGLFDNLICITPICRSPQIEERANQGARPQNPSFNYDLGAMSLKGCSLECPSPHMLASDLGSKFKMRPHSSKGQRKVPSISHLTDRLQKKIPANKPIPTSSKTECPDTTTKGVKVRSKNYNKK